MGIAGQSLHCFDVTREEMHKFGGATRTPMLPTREELIKVRRDEARAHLNAVLTSRSASLALPEVLYGAEAQLNPVMLQSMEESKQEGRSSGSNAGFGVDGQSASLSPAGARARTFSRRTRRTRRAS